MRLSHDILRGLDELACARGVTRSFLVETVLAEHVEQHLANPRQEEDLFS